MKERAKFNDSLWPVRVVAVLWVGYLITLAVIDLVIPTRLLNLLYYAVNGSIALCFFGLAHWPWAQTRLGRALMPVMIIINSAIPIVVNQAIMTAVVIRIAQNQDRLPPMAEEMALRLIPILLLALVLTAWQYQWQHVIFFSLGTAGLNIAASRLFEWLNMREPNPQTIFAELFVTTIRTTSFLVVGFFISQLVDRLRKQQKALEDANTQLVHYASTLEHLTISRERNRMARELHDTLAHTLSGLSVQLETAKAYWEVDPAAVRDLLCKSLATTRSGLEETRRALKALRASPLDDLGLALALRKLAADTTARAVLSLDVSIPEHIPSQSPDVEQCIYRIAQEAMTNVVLHAGAQNLSVHLSIDESAITLLVRDDGIGFDVKQRADSGHYGLSGMHERARLVGGHLTIESERGAGTTVYFSI